METSASSHGADQWVALQNLAPSVVSRPLQKIPRIIRQSDAAIVDVDIPFGFDLLHISGRDANLESAVSPPLPLKDLPVLAGIPVVFGHFLPAFFGRNRGTVNSWAIRSGGTW